MNQHTKDIINNLRHPKRGLKNPQIMHPEREWVIGLALMLTVFFCITLWSVGVYVVNKEVVVDETAAGAQTASVYRESMVEDALDKFAKRDVELARLMSQAPISEPVVTEVASTSEAALFLPAATESSIDVATSTGL
jgi:hypothetical protein